MELEENFDEIFFSERFFCHKMRILDDFSLTEASNWRQKKHRIFEPSFNSTWKYNRTNVSRNCSEHYQKFIFIVAKSEVIQRETESKLNYTCHFPEPKRTLEYKANYGKLNWNMTNMIVIATLSNRSIKLNLFKFLTNQ